MKDIYQKEAFDGTKHWVFDIYEDEGIGTRTKNSEHRPRSIPIHNILISLGLMNYIDDLKAKCEEKLFPSAKRTNSGQFGPESQWWGEYSSNAGITDKNVVFHSFRHSLNDTMSNAIVREEIQTAISGHAFKSLSKTTYSRSGKRGYDIGPLVEVINSIDYGLKHPSFK